MGVSVCSSALHGMKVTKRAADALGIDESFSYIYQTGSAEAAASPYSG